MYGKHLHAEGNPVTVDEVDGLFDSLEKVIEDQLVFAKRYSKVSEKAWEFNSSNPMPAGRELEAYEFFSYRLDVHLDFGNQENRGVFFFNGDMKKEFSLWAGKNATPWGALRAPRHLGVFQLALSSDEKISKKAQERVLRIYQKYDLVFDGALAGYSPDIQKAYGSLHSDLLGSFLYYLVRDGILVREDPDAFKAMALAAQLKKILRSEAHLNVIASARMIARSFVHNGEFLEIDSKKNEFVKTRALGVYQERLKDENYRKNFEAVLGPIDPKVVRACQEALKN